MRGVMADRQPVDTHRLESDLAEAIKRIAKLESRVAELEKPKGAQPMWADYPSVGGLSVAGGSDLCRHAPSHGP